MAAPKSITSTNGILPIPAAILQKQGAPSNAPRGPSKRTAAPRLKVVVRRLPPGLTQGEFEVSLGEEWKLGGGKVDWLVYRAGKVSKE
jgi:regulator of nonsense transcripts 3